MIGHWKAKVKLHPWIRGEARWRLRHERELQTWKEEYQGDLFRLLVCALLLCFGVTYAVWWTDPPIWGGSLAKAAATLNVWLLAVHVLWRMFRESVENHFDRNVTHLVNDWVWYAQYEDTYEKSRVERDRLRVKTRTQDAPAPPTSDAL